MVVFLLGCSAGEESRLTVCPQVCDCKGLTVDCGNRQLKAVPKPLPKEAKRINHPSSKMFQTKYVPYCITVFQTLDLLRFGLQPLSPCQFISHSEFSES
ncbi:hypothetical protein NPIL_658571 [Nephila pilipes]|uniref:LRRNT domain-containing protein n=1 Tax=Nephila pilipes TaxID=299642 RepID=A0A8X6NZ83_NEPPI|nr:hypothetical protein NPIL_658571 [Nephila pilipes]